MAYNVLLQYVLPYNYIILLLHCHNLKICLRIYWPSKMCIDHHLVLELACGVVTPLCYHNKVLTTKLQVIISSSLLSFSLCSPSTLWAWSRACLLLSYTLTRWPWYASSPVQDKTTPAAIACYINLEHSPSFALKGSTYSRDSSIWQRLSLTANQNKNDNTQALAIQFTSQTSWIEARGLVFHLIERLCGKDFKVFVFILQIHVTYNAQTTKIVRDRIIFGLPFLAYMYETSMSSLHIN